MKIFINSNLQNWNYSCGSTVRRNEVLMFLSWKFKFLIIELICINECVFPLVMHTSWCCFIFLSLPSPSIITFINWAIKKTCKINVIVKCRVRRWFCGFSFGIMRSVGGDLAINWWYAFFLKIQLKSSVCNNWEGVFIMIIVIFAIIVGNDRINGKTVYIISGITTEIQCSRWYFFVH